LCSLAPCRAGVRPCPPSSLTRPRGRGEGRRGRAGGTGGCPPRRRSFTSSRSSLVRHRQ